MIFFFILIRYVVYTHLNLLDAALLRKTHNISLHVLRDTIRDIPIMLPILAL